MTTTRRGVFGLFAALAAVPAALASAALRIPIGNGMPFSEYIQGTAGSFEPIGPCVGGNGEQILEAVASASDIPVSRLRGGAMSYAPGRAPIPVSRLKEFADVQAVHEQQQRTRDDMGEALERWRALFRSDPCSDLFLREPPIEHDTVQEL